MGFLALALFAFSLTTLPAQSSDPLKVHFEALQYTPGTTWSNETGGTAGSLNTSLTKGTSPTHVKFEGPNVAPAPSDRLEGSMGSLGTVNSDTRVTLEMFVKLGPPGSFLFSWDDGTNADDLGIWFRNSSQLGFATYNSDIYYMDPEPYIGKWTHFVFVFGDPTIEASQKIYANGSLAEMTLSGSPDPAAKITSNGDFVLMDSTRFDSVSWGAEAALAFAKLYVGERSQSEVTAAYQETLDRYPVITFDANSGTGNIAEQVVDRDLLTPLVANTFVPPTASSFTGWNTAPNGSDQPYSDEEQVTINSSMTLYAQWSAPTLTSSSPQDNSTFVPNTSNISLTFSRDVAAVGGKSIQLVRTSDGNALTIAADDTSQVSVSGSVVTINPTNDLDLATDYHLIVDEGAFVAASGSGIAAISDSTALNFTTDKFPYFGLTAALDSGNPTSYPGSGTTWVDVSASNQQNNVKFYGTPTFIDNPGEPKAFQFNGTSQYGRFENNSGAIPDLLNKSAYTKVVWFKPEGFDDVNNLVSAEGTYAHALWGGGNKDECRARGDNLASGHNNSWVQVRADTCLETAWQLVAVTFSSGGNDPNDGWRLYRNGDLVGSSGLTIEISEENEGYLTRIASFSNGNFFEGQIAKVLIYERPLTLAEVNSIFEAGKAEFNLNPKTVTFDANGGTVDTPTLRTNVNGSLVLRTPTKTNADFLGWFTAATGGTKVGDAGASYAPLSDLTVYAQWNNRFTVTYSPGATATGSPASANYLQSTGPLTLPTPERADFVFDGWFTAATGGTKVGDAGASYTPSSDLTLHGQWTQASLAGIPVADRTLVNTAVVTNGVSSSNTLSIGSSSVTISIPGNAFSNGVEVRTYSVANNNRAQALLPNESDFVNSIVVAWIDPQDNLDPQDDTVPVANSPVTMVISDTNIKVGAKVYSIVGNQSTLLATATEAGTVTVSFRTDPLVTVVNPVQTPPPAPPPAPFIPAQPPAAPPSTPEPVEKRELNNEPIAPEIVDGRIANPVLIDGVPADVAVREIRDSKAIEIAENDWRLEIAAKSDQGIERLVEDSVIQVNNGDRALFMGIGMRPLTVLSVYLFSEPTLLGQIETDENGEFSADLPLPKGLPAGLHTLQIGTLTADGLTVTASVPIQVGGVVNAGSFKGVVAIYAKGFDGQRLSAKVGKDWVVVDSLRGDFVRVIERVGAIGKRLNVKIYIDRRLINTIDLVTK